MAKFYYKKGPIEVTIPWERPTWGKFLKWQEDFFKIDGVENYQVGMGGNFWNGVPTWDIDIAISGNPNYKEVEHILITGTKLGFEKYNILVDLRWLSKLTMNVTEHGHIKPEKIGRLAIYKEIWKNSKRIGYLPDAVQVRKNLWHNHILIPGQKQINRMLLGQKYRDPVLLPVYKGEPMAKFYYKKGPIELTTPWERPSRSKFKKWLKDFWAIKGIENYKIWLCGGFLSNRYTWDIDIILTGTPNYQELERIMIEGTRIGFEKYNMLFDIQHHDIIPNFYPTKKKVKKIVFCDKIIKNYKVITDWSDGKKVSNNLWVVERTMPNPKQYKKILNGYKFLNPIEISKKSVWTNAGIWKFVTRLLK